MSFGDGARGVGRGHLGMHICAVWVSGDHINAIFRAFWEDECLGRGKEGDGGGDGCETHVVDGWSR